MEVEEEEERKEVKKKVQEEEGKEEIQDEKGNKKQKLKEEEEEEDYNKNNNNNKHTDIQTNLEMDTQTNTQTDTQTDTQTNTQTDTQTNTQPISKRQLKRQMKHLRWLEGKAERRRKQREKEKVKRALGITPSGPSRKALKKRRMQESECSLRVVLDLSLEALMQDRRLAQCLRQVARCYSANRRADTPLQLFVTSFAGRCREKMSLQHGYESWDVNFRPSHFTDEFAKEDLVYLTSESKNVLTKLDDGKVYVIGGLVDYNTLKGHCLGVAEGLGLNTACLPLQEHLEMKTRKVLTIDQVFRVLLGVAGGAGWREALLSSLPPRKGAKGREVVEEEEEEEEEEQEEEEKDLQGGKEGVDNEVLGNCDVD